MNNGMKNTSDTRVTSFLRICVGLLLVPATLLLLVFCFCTGRPYPPTLTPWEQLGFRYWIGLIESQENLTPRFCCFSVCGGYYATVSQRKADGKDEVLDMHVFDLATRQPICVIEGLAYAPSTIRLSADKRLVQVESDHELTVYWRPPGDDATLIELNPNGVPIGGVYNSEVGVRRICAMLSAIISDKAPDRKHRSLEAEARATRAIYFDRNIPPKALVDAVEGLELWDLSTQRRNWLIPRPFLRDLLILPDKERFITVNNFREIQVHPWKMAASLRPIRRTVRFGD